MSDCDSVVETLSATSDSTDFLPSEPPKLPRRTSLRRKSADASLQIDPGDFTGQRKVFTMGKENERAVPLLEKSGKLPGSPVCNRTRTPCRDVRLNYSPGRTSINLNQTTEGAFSVVGNAPLAQNISLGVCEGSVTGNIRCSLGSEKTQLSNVSDTPPRRFLLKRGRSQNKSMIEFSMTEGRMSDVSLTSDIPPTPPRYLLFQRARSQEAMSELSLENSISPENISHSKSPSCSNRSALQTRPSFQNPRFSDRTLPSFSYEEDSISQVTLTSDSSLFKPRPLFKRPSRICRSNNEVSLTSDFSTIPISELPVKKARSEEASMRDLSMENSIAIADGSDAISSSGSNSPVPPRYIFRSARKKEMLNDYSMDVEPPISQDSTIQNSTHKDKSINEQSETSTDSEESKGEDDGSFTNKSSEKVGACSVENLNHNTTVHSEGNSNLMIECAHSSAIVEIDDSTKNNTNKKLSLSFVTGSEAGGLHYEGNSIIENIEAQTLHADDILTPTQVGYCPLKRRKLSFQPFPSFSMADSVGVEEQNSTVASDESSKDETLEESKDEQTEETLSEHEGDISAEKDSEDKNDEIDKIEVENASATAMTGNRSEEEKSSKVSESESSRSMSTPAPNPTYVCPPKEASTSFESEKQADVNGIKIFQRTCSQEAMCELFQENLVSPENLFYSNSQSSCNRSALQTRPTFQNPRFPDRTLPSFSYEEDSISHVTLTSDSSLFKLRPLLKRPSRLSRSNYGNNNGVSLNSDFSTTPRGEMPVKITRSQASMRDLSMENSIATADGSDAISSTSNNSPVPHILRSARQIEMLNDYSMDVEQPMSQDSISKTIQNSTLKEMSIDEKSEASTETKEESKEEDNSSLTNMPSEKVDTCSIENENQNTTVQSERNSKVMTECAHSSAIVEIDDSTKNNTRKKLSVSLAERSKTDVLHHEGNSIIENIEAQTLHADDILIPTQVGYCPLKRRKLSFQPFPSFSMADSVEVEEPNATVASEESSKDETLEKSEDEETEETLSENESDVSAEKKSEDEETEEKLPEKEGDLSTEKDSEDKDDEIDKIEAANASPTSLTETRSEEEKSGEVSESESSRSMPGFAPNSTKGCTPKKASASFESERQADVNDISVHTGLILSPSILNRSTGLDSMMDVSHNQTCIPVLYRPVAEAASIMNEGRVAKITREVLEILLAHKTEKESDKVKAQTDPFYSKIVACQEKAELQIAMDKNWSAQFSKPRSKGKAQKNAPGVKPYSVRLHRPARWANKHLYNFLQKKLAAKHSFSNIVLAAESIVKELDCTVKKVVKSDRYQKVAINRLKKDLAKNNIIVTTYDFYDFVRAFMPREFQVKVIPMVQPFTNVVWPPKDSNLKESDPIIYSP